MGRGDSSPPSGPRFAPRRGHAGRFASFVLLSLVAAPPASAAEANPVAGKVLSSRLLRAHLAHPAAAFCHEALRMWDDHCARVYAGRLDLSPRESASPQSPFRRSAPLDIERLLSTLATERAALVAFALGPEDGWALVAGGDRIEAVLLSGWERAADLIERIKVGVTAPRGEADAEALEELSRVVVDPWIDLLPEGTRRLVIMPDTVLAGMPFEALPLPGGAESRDRLLVEAFHVAYAPSASSWLAMRDRVAGAERPGAFLAVDDSVDAGIELVALAAEPLPRPVRLVPGAVPDDAKLGPLAAIARSSLDAELVVVPRRRNASDHPGLMLPAALLEAGARSVVAPVWDPTDRAAAAFLERLRRYLSRGGPTVEALRSAKLAMIRSGDPVLADPAAWAPYLFVGGTTSRPETGPRWPRRAAVIGLVAVAMALFGLRVARMRGAKRALDLSVPE
jgi:hypothetical protein